jgi:putative SOS response-associated peptidase YedK
MCGRYTLASPDDTIAEVFDLTTDPTLVPRYNIAPTQDVAVLRTPPAHDVREIEMLRWGLIPSWAKDPAIGNRMINARSETVDQKPSFKAAFRRRRCLVVADGFYEWQRLTHGKQPHYIRLTDGEPFAFAGLWERWEGADGIVIETCTILTTAANELMAPLHDRMPVILERSHHDLWLDPEMGEARALKPLLEPYPSEKMTAHAVSKLVNNPGNDDPKCVQPAS